MSDFNRTFDFALRLFASERLSFVVKLFAARKTELYFRPAVFEVQAQRDKSEAPFLGLAGEPLDLARMQQELSRARRFMIELIRPRIGTDMDIQ